MPPYQTNPQLTPLPQMQPAPMPPKNRLAKFLWLVVVVLLSAIIVMLALWKPWANEGSDRTIQVSGQATIKAEPDEFVFYPSYDFKNADKTKALADLTAKSDEIVAQLKKLGVADNKIKTNADGYEKGLYYPVETSTDTTYTLTLTITLTDKELAQKVQDYLVTTTPSGAVTPQAAFSEEKQKKLESQARAEAEKDARGKAEDSAKNLGFKLGKVKDISESGFGGPISILEGQALSAEDASSAQLTVQPGENELTYSLSVTYFIK